MSILKEERELKKRLLKKTFPKKELEKLLKAGDLRLEKFIKAEEEKVEEIDEIEIESRDRELNEEQKKQGK